MRSTLTLALAASATLLVTACGDGEESGGVTPGGRLDLTLSAAGFDPHNGEVMSVALVDGAGAIIATRAALVANGGFTMTFPASLEAAAGYTLAYYVDHDRDGRCGSPGLAGDHGWQIELTAGDQAVTRSLTHNLNFAPSVCGRFPLYDLALAGSFAPHANQDMYVAVIRDLDGLVVNATTTRVPADGYLALTIPGVVQAGTTYSIDHDADVDGDGICEGPAFTQDHGWRSRVGEVSGSVAVAGSDAAAFEPEVCASFPGGQPGGPFDLSITGSGFTPHNGQVLSLALSVDGTIQARRAVVVTNGGFAMTLPAGLELGRSYRIDYYVDRDRDGICSPPTLAGDHGWSSTISVVSGAVDLALTHSISFDAAVCGSFPTRDLSFAGAYL
ncbi:MAG: hypothetical protein HY903_02195, partial [Deltaproteobacteria bacterium]|nr:hypothetical protein [Deltaproteobacteria bacterium]